MQITYICFSRFFYLLKIRIGLETFICYSFKNGGGIFRRYYAILIFYRYKLHLSTQIVVDYLYTLSGDFRDDPRNAWESGKDYHAFLYAGDKIFYPGGGSPGDSHLLPAELFYDILFTRMVDGKSHNKDKCNDSSYGHPDGNPYIGQESPVAFVVTRFVHGYQSSFFLSSYRFAAKIT